MATKKRKRRARRKVARKAAPPKRRRVHRGKAVLHVRRVARLATGGASIWEGRFGAQVLGQVVARNETQARRKLRSVARKALK